MTTICPKCRHIRPANAQAPDWQCPACGIAYAKAGTAAPAPVAVPGVGYRATPQRGGLPWGKLLVLAAAAGGVYWGHQKGLLQGGDEYDEAVLRQLAATVRAEQVVMYSTTECGHCTQARSWLNHHGFAFTECNMSHDAGCVDRFRALGADGTPYLVVRGPRGEHHMKEGFNTDEFLAALKG